MIEIFTVIKIDVIIKTIEIDNTIKKRYNNNNNNDYQNQII